MFQRRGCFAVPRERTSAEVAAALGVDRPTAIETIRRGAVRVIEQFLVGRGRVLSRRRTGYTFSAR